MKVDSLVEGETMFLEGGWEGLADSGRLLHLIQRTGIDTFSFTTFNKGPGKNNAKIRVTWKDLNTTLLTLWTLPPRLVLN